MIPSRVHNLSIIMVLSSSSSSSKIDTIHINSGGQVAVYKKMPNSTAFFVVNSSSSNNANSSSLIFSVCLTAENILPEISVVLETTFRSVHSRVRMTRVLGIG